MSYNVLPSNFPTPVFQFCSLEWHIIYVLLLLQNWRQQLSSQFIQPFPDMIFHFLHCPAYPLPNVLQLVSVSSWNVKLRSKASRLQIYVVWETQRSGIIIYLILNTQLSLMQSRFVSTFLGSPLHYWLRMSLQSTKITRTFPLNCS